MVKQCANARFIWTVMMIWIGRYIQHQSICGSDQSSSQTYYNNITHKVIHSKIPIFNSQTYISTVTKPPIKYIMQTPMTQNNLPKTTTTTKTLKTTNNLRATIILTTATSTKTSTKIWTKTQTATTELTMKTTKRKRTINQISARSKTTAWTTKKTQKKCHRNINRSIETL